MKINATEESFELMEMLGQRVLFTNMRVDRDSVPQNLYVYEVRHDDDCTGEICEIKPFVMVNHWGTIICYTILRGKNHLFSQYSHISSSDIKAYQDFLL